MSDIEFVFTGKTKDLRLLSVLLCQPYCWPLDLGAAELPSVYGTTDGHEILLRIERDLARSIRCTHPVRLGERLRHHIDQSKLLHYGRWTARVGDVANAVWNSVHPSDVSRRNHPLSYTMGMRSIVTTVRSERPAMSEPCLPEV